MACYTNEVRMPLTICRTLAALALLGLMLAPLTRPVMAFAGMPGDIAQHETMDGTSPLNPAAMPNGMPCCPDETPMPDCSKHCQMAMCAPSVLLSLPAQSGVILLTLTSNRFVERQDSAPSGVPIAPPPKPPRA